MSLDNQTSRAIQRIPEELKKISQILGLIGEEYVSVKVDELQENKKRFMKVFKASKRKV